MECGVCGIVYEEDLMIPGKYGFGICIDCARKLLSEIVEIVEKHDWEVVGDLIAEKLAEAKLLKVATAAYM